MTAKPKKKKPVGQLVKKRKDIAGIGLVAISVLLIVSFITRVPSEATGWFGNTLARALQDFLGILRYSVPILLIWWSISEFRHKEFQFKYSMAAGVTVFIIGGSMLLHLISPEAGGALGDFINDAVLGWVLGTVGCYIISIALIFISLILLTDISVKKVFGFLIYLLKIIKLMGANFLKNIMRRKKQKKEESTAKKKRSKKKAKKKRKKQSGARKEKKSADAPGTLPKTKSNLTSREGGYMIPVDLLNPKKETDRQIDLEEDRGERLTEVLLNFDIETEISDIQVGPAITRYEIITPPGLKLSRIRNLSSNIAMALEAKTVRLLTPIPGKSTVGVEVPAIKQDIVNIRELVSSQTFKDAKTDIPYSLGKSIDGSLTVADLGDMPHLRLAGATGSGKSVAIHTLITSILYKSEPEKVKFLLIDPKRVELPAYNGIPHLIEDVIRDSNNAVKYLEAITKEMDNRYDILASHNVADITSYNNIKKGDAEDLKIMPRIIVVIDELADLMVVAKDRVENAIVRIAQMARAVGIHLVLATQRPSVDVITGVIKANLPARISFNVLSGIDSRTILDSIGAEKLLGKGDMLYLSSKAPQPDRIQGGFITREETVRIVDYLKEAELNIGEEIDLKELSKKNLNSAQSKDELYEEALRLIVKRGKASISMLQRKLRIGYNRAARIVDHMYEDGLVGEDRGSKGRKVLVTKQDLEVLSEK
ncbi:MAG: DNA translocase FtsK 4TM domain-containing protein [Elusimicrobia bacterium]|jgi:S-DNA-T family DNA segregation ATPase FtsK/SpoIIIE|nr:DNA translocase FtsK 4TM domain-containing protein [Elusimicrobiota bacterium]